LEGTTKQVTSPTTKGEKISENLSNLSKQMSNPNTQNDHKSYSIHDMTHVKYFQQGPIYIPNVSLSFHSNHI
jgi:hypothetical protein